MIPFLFALILVAGAYPFLHVAFPPRRRWLSCLGLLALSWPLGTLLHGWKQPTDLQLRPVVQLHDQFVGSGSCRTCHAHQYDTWHSSYHRSMTQVAGPGAIQAPFDGRAVEVDERHYRFFRRGTEYWVEYDDVFREDFSPTSDNPFARALQQQAQVRTEHVQRRIVLVTGSHHYQVYWFSPNDTRMLAHLPVVFLLDERRWIPRHSSFVVSTECSAGAYLEMKGTGVWNMGCIRCHATHGRPRPEFDPANPLAPIDTMQTDVAEFGIACESCHGPGETHILANRNPFRRRELFADDLPDPTIRNPARMDHARSAATCGQCHAVQYFNTRQRAQAWREAGYEYRAGDDLEQTRLIISLDKRQHPMMSEVLQGDPDYLTNSFWRDGMVRITGREFNGLQNTACYTHGTMSCLSCHAMHQPADDRRGVRDWAHGQMKPEMSGNEACLQCHQDYRRDLPAHTHHTEHSTGSQCYNCHMPHTSYGLLKGVRSHQISSPNVSTTLETGRPNACNLCHLDQTLDWTNQHLDEWYGRERLVLATEHRDTAASLLWLLRGNAAQRILVASRMTWQPARDVSGINWMAPFVATLLDDDYEALRLVGSRTLKTLPGFADLDYDFLQDSIQREQAVATAIRDWHQQRAAREWPRRLLLHTDGQLRQDEIGRLMNTRDNTRLLLAE